MNSSSRVVPIERAPLARLREECRARNLPCLGDREERIDRLKEAGVDYAYLDLPVSYAARPSEPPPSDPTCVCVGANPKRMQRHTFSIANAVHPERPILSGHFRERTVTIDRMLRLVSTSDLKPDTPGLEGDLRRKGSELYMYRSLGPRSGWYRLAFDHALM